MKHSLRYRLIIGKVDKEKSYTVNDALDLVKEMSIFEMEVGKDKYKRKLKIGFNESVEFHVNLNLKAKHTIRDTIILPHQITVEEKRILVFAKGDKADEALKAGATYVADDEMIEKIKGGWFDFDVALATPDMMGQVGKIGKLLGPRGLMPNPKTGTVTNNLKDTIEEFKKGKIEYRADKYGIIHVVVGKVNMNNEQILENTKAIYQEILKKKPSDLKGEYVKSTAFASTMGPGVKFVASSLV